MSFLIIVSDYEYGEIEEKKYWFNKKENNIVIIKEDNMIFKHKVNSPYKIKVIINDKD